VRPALLLLAALVVGSVLFGPALVEPWRGESPSVAKSVTTVVDEAPEAEPQRVDVTGHGCYGPLRPGIRPLSQGCERIRERRGGVETRLGSVEIPGR
jgi:hypothetical protein